jgi:hypothetical protein
MLCFDEEIDSNGNPPESHLQVHVQVHIDQAQTHDA